MSTQPASTAPSLPRAPPPTPVSTSTKPPVTLGQTTHLDQGAYVRGSHGITLGEQTLIQPRSHLVATHGPLFIGDKCIVSEKCVIGGPVATADSHPSLKLSGLSSSGSGSPLVGPQDSEQADESDPVKTTIHSNVYIHANSHVHAGATIHDAVIIEPHVTVLAGVTVGAHAKICAGVTVDRDLDEWTVVYGNGDVKRRRRRRTDTEDVDIVEAMRLKAMDKEREGTVAILKMAARMATLAKKK